MLLSVTGCEALYSDVAIFGRLPIQLTWSTLVMGSLVLCYSGQAAVLLDPAASPDSKANPFFALAATVEWRGALVVLSMLATLIASQSVISGAFAVMEQAKALGFVPPSLAVVYPGGVHAHGQIYLPGVNTALWVACFTLVLVFQTSSNLASAYGLAVTGAMLVDSLLLLPVFLYLWSWDPLAAALCVLPFVVVDALFFSAGNDGSPLDAPNADASLVHQAWPSSSPAPGSQRSCRSSSSSCCRPSTSSRWRTCPRARPAATRL